VRQQKKINGTAEYEGYKPTGAQLAVVVPGQVTIYFRQISELDFEATFANCEPVRNDNGRPIMGMIGDVKSEVAKRFERMVSPRIHWTQWDGTEPEERKRPDYDGSAPKGRKNVQSI
jgi:hypothetical protein